jgi:hypothetical protein
VKRGVLIVTTGERGKSEEFFSGTRAADECLLPCQVVEVEMVIALGGRHFSRDITFTVELVSSGQAPMLQWFSVWRRF